jgi:hypothetical protein
MATSLSYLLVILLSFEALRKKKVREFPVPSRDVTTKLSLGGNNDVITELFLRRETREPFFTVCIPLTGGWGHIQFQHFSKSLTKTNLPDMYVHL